MKLKKVKVKLSKKESFYIMVDEYTADNLDACLTNWSVRTKEFTSQSLADYINSKSYAGCKAELIN